MNVIRVSFTELTVMEVLVFPAGRTWLISVQAYSASSPVVGVEKLMVNLFVSTLVVKG